jgi:hypothetical protein
MADKGPRESPTLSILAVLVFLIPVQHSCQMALQGAPMSSSPASASVLQPQSPSSPFMPLSLAPHPTRPWPGPKLPSHPDPGSGHRSPP